MTETKCVVRLQQLLNNTIERLFKFLNLSFYDKENTTLLLILKYGFDGTNANAYRQKSDDKHNSFSNIFCCSLVPLQLIDKTTKIVHWENPRPSSIKLCRPIKISYEKETDELCKNEERDIMAQIDELQDVSIAGCTVQFEMILTMIDGKVVKSNTRLKMIIIYLFVYICNNIYTVTGG